MHFASRIVIVSLPALCFFQHVSESQTLELQAEGGVLTSSIHAPSDSLLKHSFYQAATLGFAWHADTTCIYTHLNKNPLYGLAVYAGTFHNRSIGDPLAVLFYIKTPLYQNEHWKLFYQIGAGLAWNFSPYDPDLNRNNWLTGTRVNMIGNLSLGFEYCFWKRWYMGGAVGYRHFSNGSVKWPNYGINIIPFSLHAAFDVGWNAARQPKNAVPVFLPFNSLTIFCAPSSRGSSDGKNYFAGTLGLLWMKQMSYRIGLGGGFDLFFNASGKTKVLDNESDLQKVLSGGLYASFNWMFTERFFINAGGGLYLWRHAGNDEHYSFYERISARYLLRKRLLLGVGIKINGNASDYIEWTLGYILKNDKNVYRQNER